jgi:xylulokinase
VNSRPTYLMGVDLGSSNLKATIIRSDGTLAGEASHPIETQIPHPGWSEQNPDEWYAAFCKAVPHALKRAGITAPEIAGIGFSGGAHIPVLTDADDAVIRPAILWADQRSIAEARELHEKHGEMIIRTSLNRANPTWALAMLKWLRKHEPDAVRRTRKLFIAKDWLRWRITGSWHTDYSDVIGALMADNKTRNWSPEICTLIDWDMTTLPPVVEPSAVVGHVTEAAARETGLAAGTPVVCGANDTTVEIYGVGATKAGQGAIKLATAGVVFLTTEGPAVHPPISCYPHIVPGKYYCATGMNSCASAHKWLRDRMFLEPGGDGSAAFARMDEMAATVPPGSLGLIFHPYLQGERGPHWDPKLKADFVGLTMQHGREHFARALYEGIAYALCDLLTAAKDQGLSFDEFRIIGGGARSATWRQIVADVLGVEIRRPENGDASFGAALVAGVGVGTFASYDDAVARCVRLLDTNKPDAARHALYREMFEIYRDVQKRLVPVNHQLHDKFVGS